MGMENAKTITISLRIYAELNAFMNALSGRLKRRVTIDDALEDLLPRAHRNKPSDFAGAWVMSDEEGGEIKKSLKELFGGVVGCAMGLRMHMAGIARVISEQVSRGRSVMMRVAGFLAGACLRALYLHLAGVYVDRWWLGVE